MAVFMVSLDEPEKNAAFAKSLGGSQVVLSDPLGEAGPAYGVVSPGGEYAKRWTFYIDPGGIVRKVDQSVSPSSAGQDIVENLDMLGFPKKKQGN